MKTEKMVDVSPNISVTAININELKSPTKSRDYQNELKK